MKYSTKEELKMWGTAVLFALAFAVVTLIAILFVELIKVLL